MTRRRDTDHPSQTAIWARHAIIGAGALVLAVAFLVLFMQTAQTLALLFAAIVIGEALSPVVDRLERWMPRGVAVAAVYAGLVIVVGGMLWFITPRIADQSRQLVEDLPGITGDIRGFLEDNGLGTDSDLWSLAQDNIGRVTGALVSVPMSVVTSVTQIVLIIFMSIYWLIARESLRTFLRSLVPDDRQPTLDGVLGSLSGTVGGYVRGIAIGAVIIGISVYAGLTVMGVQFAAVLAILAAFGEVIPILGPIVAAIPAVIIAFFQSPGLALAVIIFYVVLQQIESNVIVPNVMSSQVSIPPILVIIATAAGGSIGGVLGAIIAIPIVGAVKVLIVEVAAPGIRRWTGATAGPRSVQRATEQADIQRS
jgi:putative heme transporter